MSRPLISLAALLLVGCIAADSTIDPNLAASIRWYTGEAGQVDDARARSLLEQAASDSDPISTMWVARVYSTGRMTFPADKSRAQDIANSVIAEIETLANSGQAEAMFLLGTAYAEGLGKSVDHQAAASWYRQAAELGNTLAQHNMGNIYRSGTGVQQNDALAVGWWTLAAEKGDAITQLRLGEMYEAGTGVGYDLQQAKAWYSKAAASGNEAAANALSDLN